MNNSVRTNKKHTSKKIKKKIVLQVVLYNLVISVLKSEILTPHKLKLLRIREKFWF